MQTQRILFYDTENDGYYGGIRFDNGDVMCAHCGGIIPSDEQNEEYGFRLVKKYKIWIDFSDGIIEPDDIVEDQKGR